MSTLKEEEIIVLDFFSFFVRLIDPYISIGLRDRASWIGDLLQKLIIAGDVSFFYSLGQVLEEGEEGSPEMDNGRLPGLAEIYVVLELYSFY